MTTAEERAAIIARLDQDEWHAWKAKHLAAAPPLSERQRRIIGAGLAQVAREQRKQHDERTTDEDGSR